MNEQRNLIIAIALAVLVMTVYSVFFGPTPPQRPAQQQATEQSAEAPKPQAESSGQQASQASGQSGQQSGSGGDMLPEAGTSAAQKTSAGPARRSREAVLQDDPRVPIDTPRIEGSINLVGGRLDDLTLKDYHQEPNPKSPNVVLLQPEGTGKGYYARYGWVSAESGVKLPDAETRWQVQQDKLTLDQPVTLTWTNPRGITFKRTYRITSDYMFRVTQSVVNKSGRTVELFPYGLINRHGTPEVSRFLILHEGPLGVYDGQLHEFSYKDLRADPITVDTDSGWLGLTDKYWLVSLIPKQGTGVEARYTHAQRGGQDQYQVDFRGPGRVLESGESYQTSSRLFAGAKKVDLLDKHREENNVPLFDKAVDFGWFYFLTKPFFYALDFLYDAIGNFGLAIIAFTCVLRLLMFPLAQKSFTSMNKMKKLQPQMQELRQRYSDDKQRLNQEMMQLYKREKVNPAAGCLPILIQLPIFFALYKVLFVTIEMRHTPFFGWLQDLSAKDPTTIFNLFGLIPYQPPEILTIGALPCIMGLSLWLQMRLNPSPGDSFQQKLFTWLPVVFTVILARFPAGLVLYWTSNNLLSMLQQVVLMKRQGVPIQIFNKGGEKAAST